MTSVFLTGATGFVGGHVLRRLAAAGHGPIRCLVRDPARLPDVGGDVQAVVGDLENVSAWASALEGCDTVVHLAALTGKASEAEHFRVNADGTRRLLRHAAAAGVRRFLFVSTIAVTYPDKRHSPYARAKDEAEVHVRTGGLDWAVLRPTVVLGPGSPLWEKFRSLAAAPVMPVFGNGRNRIQPVHVGDVARCLEAMVAGGTLGARTIELGGRDSLTLEEFLVRIRRAVTGKDGPAVHLPVGAIIRVLALMEPLLLPVMPVGAGQFYVFAHDADAADDPDAVPPREVRCGVDDLIAEHVEADRRGAGRPVTDAELDAECSLLCRHLIGQEPGDYLREKYRAAHRPGAFGPARGGPDPLLAAARRGPLFTRLVDAWSALLDRGGTFRRKLVLLVALLESTGETAARVDTPDRGSPAGFFAGMALRGLGFAVTFAVALVAVPVLRLLEARRAKEAPAG